jgi:DNA-binding HxlR family transcriptional regulator
MSSSVLYDRLRELTEAGLLRRGVSDSYELTEIGAGLSDALKPLDTWAREWSSERSELA